jgi:hypothetical protein
LFSCFSLQENNLSKGSYTPLWGVKKWEMTTNGKSVISLDWRLENLFPVHFEENGLWQSSLGDIDGTGPKKAIRNQLPGFPGAMM